MNSKIIKFYQKPGLPPQKVSDLHRTLRDKIDPSLTSISTELCYYVELTSDLTEAELHKLKWILGNYTLLQTVSYLQQNECNLLIEVGPRFNFSTSNSSNAVSICKSLKLHQIVRIEVSRRYLFETKNSKNVRSKILAQIHDRMTEHEYTIDNIPKCSFNESLVKSPDLKDIPVLTKGRKALEEINDELGLAFDSADLDYYTNLFKNDLKRNPTSVECFDLAQSNSEHSRHWFFKGEMIIDGEKQDQSLIDMIIDTQNYSNPNNVIKFSDNSSAIIGYKHKVLRPKNPGKVSELIIDSTDSHLIFTAETHNFPTGVAPFSGATTGTGGRIRDVQAVGRGGHCIAGTVGYSTGNLLIPGYEQDWEDSSAPYPVNFAPPLEIMIQASNGASDYGNKFGEPLICGFTRTFGLTTPQSRLEYIKPIMFSGGIGFMDASQTKKQEPEPNMLIVKIGGPVYRIGVGGGAASSVEVQGDNKVELDFNAVQRGDAEMEQKLNRVVRACVELGVGNPIVSIHDQGAGGNGNVLKEIVEPVGGVIYADRFELGDPTINALELWGAEYQENNAILIHPESKSLLDEICTRERCPYQIVGEVEATGQVVLTLDSTRKETPFNLPLSAVLGSMPKKRYQLIRNEISKKPLSLPEDLRVALKKVLSLPTVCSKRFLTTKVDRCVTGLIAQQQCVGPLHTPLADVAVTAISYTGVEGIASSIGEQPIKGLLDCVAGARMTVGEALSNLVFAVISDLSDVKCSGNWMWPAKLEGEGAKLYDTCKAMCDLMKGLGIAIDGGKDSLSMAARVNDTTIKSPGTLVVSTYAPCPNIYMKVTPDLKGPAQSNSTSLLFVDLSNGLSRLGGSALAQVYSQLGSTPPNLECAKTLVSAFKITQTLIKEGLVLAGHDVSDGGLIVTILEMAFAGLSGLQIDVNHKKDGPMEILFAEELGWVLEVQNENKQKCLNMFREEGVQCVDIGKVAGYGINSKIQITVNSVEVINTTLLPLFQEWEQTSYQLELLQTTSECATQEFNSLATRSGPKYKLTFNPDDLPTASTIPGIKVAILREEGTNGDREMAYIFKKVGFEVWDVTMQDLIQGSITLNQFRGIVFPGGFSYADVLGSAKGWAASILFNPKLKKQFNEFYNRPETFSLGVCNGCQLMSLIGWIGSIDESTLESSIHLDHNISNRFECRYTTVRIQPSKAIMLQGMNDSVLGVWNVHGEGRFSFQNTQLLDQLESENLVALKYVDDEGKPTELYPFNQNGSPRGVAGICSNDGRHLAMMPHPERCALKYQCPYIPSELQKFQNSPWEKMFQNAYDWCTK